MKKWMGFIGVALILSCAPAVLAGTQQETDEHFVNQNWAASIKGYQILLSDDDDNAGNWFNLASSLHQTEQYLKAHKAYQTALEKGYAREPQIRIRLARIHMAQENPDEALDELERLVDLGAPNGRVLSRISEFEPLLRNNRFLVVVQALTPCTDDIYRAFDFWLGAWDVYGNGSDTPTAKSKISTRENGCVVLEEYQTFRGYTGMSINFYDPSKETWHQTWMANNGTPNYLEGGLTKEGAMQLSDANLPISEITGVINRVTWTPNKDGSVRQYWENSSDKGETWTVGFDGHYAPSKEKVSSDE